MSSISIAQMQQSLIIRMSFYTAPVYPSYWSTIIFTQALPSRAWNLEQTLHGWPAPHLVGLQRQQAPALQIQGWCCLDALDLALTLALPVSHPQVVLLAHSSVCV